MKTETIFDAVPELSSFVERILSDPLAFVVLEIDTIGKIVPIAAQDVPSLFNGGLDDGLIKRWRAVAAGNSAEYRKWLHEPADGPALALKACGERDSVSFELARCGLFGNRYHLSSLRRGGEAVMNVAPELPGAAVPKRLGRMMERIVARQGAAREAARRETHTEFVRRESESLAAKLAEIFK